MVLWVSAVPGPNTPPTTLWLMSFTTQPSSPSDSLSLKSKTTCTTLPFNRKDDLHSSLATKTVHFHSSFSFVINQAAWDLSCTM